MRISVSNHHARLRRGIWTVGLDSRHNNNDQDEEEEEVDMEEDDELDSEMEHSDEDALNGNRISNMRRSSDMLSMSERLSIALNSSSLAPVLARDFGGPTSQPVASSNSDTDPNDLLSRAVANGLCFQPKWSPLHCSSSIKVDEESQQVACVTEGGNNGHCVRSAQSIPTSRSSTLQLDNDEATVRDAPSVFGWRIVFEHPTREKGRNLGGCYLIGITTDEFTDFNSHSGLQQSRLFWGIEDNGRKYEGGTRGMAVALGSRAGGAPRNSDNALFASKEIITAVIDFDGGTLNLWRDGRFLGPVVSGLPKSTNFFPVAVPFSAGVCVAITGLTSCPSVV